MHTGSSDPTGIGGNTNLIGSRDKVVGGMITAREKAKYNEILQEFNGRKGHLLDWRRCVACNDDGVSMPVGAASVPLSRAEVARGWIVGSGSAAGVAPLVEFGTGCVLPSSWRINQFLIIQRGCLPEATADDASPAASPLQVSYSRQAPPSGRDWPGRTSS
jgi:hypothetical protein